MRGLDISREFYLQHGVPMLEELFGDVIDRIAIGVVGEGSECLGFDDEISRDHDFDAGFCLWITSEDERKFGFKLERAYSKLPKEFMGLRKSAVTPVGGSRRGVMTIDNFYARHLGAPKPPSSAREWLYTPSSSLLAASNGEVFTDKLGEFSKIRNELLCGYPEDIRRKKLASHIVFMAQAGQYNYARCISRGETGAAQLAIFEFVKHTISAIYLLNNKYEPFYKWAYRGLTMLDTMGNMGDILQTLTEIDSIGENAVIKQEAIEDIAVMLITELQAQQLTEAVCTDLEKHAYSVLDGICDIELRNMHIMEGI